MAHLGARKWQFLGVENDDFDILLESGREVPETRRIGEIFGLAGQKVDENRQSSPKIFSPFWLGRN